jgi:hypothetical protein
VPWLVGPGVFLTRAAHGLPGDGKPYALATTTPPFLFSIVVCVLSLALNAILFWTHIRGEFLTWRTALVPFMLTFSALTSGFLLLWGILLLLRAEVEIAFVNAVAIDVTTTAHVVALGITFQIPAFLLSSLWKTEGSGASQRRLYRDTVIKALPSVLQGEETYIQDLKSALEKLVSERAASALPTRDTQLLNRWCGAADSLKSLLEGYEARDLRRFAGENRTKIEEDLNTLKEVV